MQVRGVLARLSNTMSTSRNRRPQGRVVASGAALLRDCRLSGLLLLLLGPPFFTPLTPTRDHRLRFEVREQTLAHLLDEETSQEVDDHGCRQLEFELNNARSLTACRG